MRASERAVSTNDDQTVEAEVDDLRVRPRLPHRCQHLETARRAEDGAPLPRDPLECIGIDGSRVGGQEAGVTVPNADDLVTARPTDDGERADRRVHPRRVSS